MGKAKEKLQKFMDNPDVAFKEQMGYVSGVFELYGSGLCKYIHRSVYV